MVLVLPESKLTLRGTAVAGFKLIVRLPAVDAGGTADEHREKKKSVWLENDVLFRRRLGRVCFPTSV